MADKHPYISSAAGLIKAVGQLRKSFPKEVTSTTLKKLSIAPNNETYVINILRFAGVIDQSGTATSDATKAFSKHSDAEFASAFAAMVKKAYKELFDLHGDSAWTLGNDDLIGFFRTADQTSAIVGQRQAATFRTLAALAGHQDLPAAKSVKAAKGSAATKSAKSTKSTSKTATTASPANPNPSTASANVPLTVRIEINLPVADDQETYDRIFKSIRENLLND